MTPRSADADRTRGAAPAGLGIFMLETLTVLGGDEPRTMYGLLAQEMRIEPDLSAITWRLHPLARFSNGGSCGTSLPCTAS